MLPKLRTNSSTNFCAYGNGTCFPSFTVLQKLLTFQNFEIFYLIAKNYPRIIEGNKLDLKLSKVEAETF